MRDWVLRTRATAEAHGWSYVAAWGVIDVALGLWALQLIREGLML